MSPRPITPSADRSGKRIALVTTGGTISTSDAGAGAVPVLNGGDLLRTLGSAAGLPAVDVIEFARIPGCEMTPTKMAALATVVRDEVARDDRAAVVVTHGTDTIEESAFLCHLSVDSDKPVVFTGSMRTASDVSWDGPRNLLDALRVAASARAQGLGTLLVMHEEIHSARFVTKTNGLTLGTFQSLACGPVGRIYGGSPMFFSAPLRPQRILEPILNEAVAQVRVLSGDRSGLDAALARSGLRGLVIEGFGGGRVPASWCDPLGEAVRRGIAVVLASRTGAGAIGDSYGYPGSATSLLALGLIPAHELPAHKARLQLMLALGNGLRGQELRAYFENES